jgi:hypothetical protein
MANGIAMKKQIWILVLGTPFLYLFSISLLQAGNLKVANSSTPEEINTFYKKQYEQKLESWHKSPMIFKQHQLLQIVAVNEASNAYQMSFVNLGKIGTQACKDTVNNLKPSAEDRGFIWWSCLTKSKPAREVSEVETLQVYGYSGRTSSDHFTLASYPIEDREKSLAQCGVESGNNPKDKKKFDNARKTCYLARHVPQGMSYEEDTGSKKSRKPLMSAYKGHNGIVKGGIGCEQKIYLNNPSPSSRYCYELAKGALVQAQFPSDTAFITMDKLVDYGNGTQVGGYRLHTAKENISPAGSDPVLGL